MKQFLLLCCLAWIAPNAGSAQYITAGKIEYERRTNLLRMYETETWFENMKDNMPKVYITYSDLLFNSGKSRYQPGREVEQDKKLNWGTPPGADNVVLQDFSTASITAAKQVFEQKFFIQDSARRLPWKISTEVRTIAGYRCRKAVTRICDSVYVVAFYTDDIAVSGGPEQFGGLPGMILELAVPRLYTTWVATKVELAAPKEEDLKAPEGKGKKISQKELAKSIQSSLKDWGKWGERAVWWAML